MIEYKWLNTNDSIPLQVPKTPIKVDCIPEERHPKTWGRKVHYLTVGHPFSRSTRPQLAKHRRGRLPCWIGTDRHRAKRAESPKAYRGMDLAHIPDRILVEVTAAMADLRRKTTRQYPIEDYVPIPEKHRASPVRKSEKRALSESIRGRHLIVAQLLRLVSMIIL
jgi:hypothetical protein